MQLQRLPALKALFVADWKASKGCDTMLPLVQRGSNASEEQIKNCLMGPKAVPILPGRWTLV